VGARQHIVTGAVAGLASGLVLLLVRLEPGGAATGLLDVGPAGVDVALHLAASLLLGAGLGLVVRDLGRSYAATIASGLLVGLLWWIVGPLTLAPLLDADAPTWKIDEATAAFPSLIGSLFFGGLAGAAIAALSIVGLRAHGGETAPAARAALAERRIVILGGGFGGVAAAHRLERIFARDPSVEISIVSESNYLLFTPMLAEVASSALQAQHISSPVRAACPRTRFRRAEVVAVDTDGHAVMLRAIGSGTVETLSYDHLVLALGSVPTYRGLPGMEEHSFALKSLHDATTLRNHVISLLELADALDDADERRRMLTFVVVGGGFAGTEMIAELFDLVHIVLRYYPHIPEDEPRFVLVHSRDRILPELGAELAGYALRKLEARGIEFVLETRVAGATPDELLLGGEQTIPTRTIVWTAGNQPNPLLSRLSCERNDAGAVVTDPTLRVPGFENVWAVGDCAQIPDPDSEGGFYPPTAQHALREGKVAAENIAAAMRGREPKPFRFRTIGMLVALGHRTAAGEIRGRQFSGLLAWLMWRGVYWSKLPGAEKKVRVFLDWTIDLAFPRDIVLTSPPAASPKGEPVAGDP